MLCHYACNFKNISLPNYFLSALTLPGPVLPAAFMNMVNFKWYLCVDVFAMCRRIKTELCGVPYTAYQSDSEGGTCRCLPIIFRVQSLLFCCGAVCCSMDDVAA